MKLSTVPVAVTAFGTALLLSACAGGGGSTAPETVTQTVAATGTAPAGSDSASTPTADSSAGAERDDSSASEQASGADPVFAAIDAALAAHPGGIVVEIDREDGGSVTYDIDVVVGNTILELEVDASGAVRVDDRDDDDDDDDIADAHRVRVPAAEAITQALDRHPGGVLDELDLDSDDGALWWEIELDDANRDDLAEVRIPAV